MSDASFLGRGWGFPPQFHRSPDGIQVRMVEKQEDIDESLRILFSTKAGERLLDPDYGTLLHQVQFEALNETLRSRITRIIEKAVLLFEPRVTLQRVNLLSSEDDATKGRVRIELEYVIRATNSRTNMVFPFYFFEGTDL